MKESMTQRRGAKGRRGGGSLYSCTLNHTHTGSDYPFHTHSHTHMNSAGELKHIKRHREQKKKKKRKSRIRRQLAQSLRQRTPPSSSSSSSNPDTQRNWNKQEKTDQQCAHRIRVMQAEYLNR